MSAPYKNTIGDYFSPEDPYTELQLERMKDVRDRFHSFYLELEAVLTPGPETTTCFRKLLEAKNCAERAVSRT